ncbi:DNA/RNA non-specific endonuclease [gut metagenome]|uniref:DNA/RNA non-specific endonuclease n=1 Tax=gut metagenome TaxID=749906 RepID=J9GQK0_9ZZZZ
MAAKKNQQSKSVYYFIAFLCIVCLAYEPLSKVLSKRKISLENKQTTEKTIIEQIAERKTNSEKIKSIDLKKQEKRTSTKTPDKSQKQTTTSSTTIPTHARLELPASLKGKRSELILHRTGYSVSYNRDWKIPNWVAWELNRQKLIERESRSNKFLPDPDLTVKEAVTTDDYKRSGWDRGHMCPAGDNRWHWKAMQESFYMTNICPQNNNLNRGDWKELEENCRKWAEREGKIYIVCGPILYNMKHEIIGKEHKIIVPEAFFKVILCTTSKPAKSIGFIYKNTSGNRPLDAYVNSVDDIERITGIDFFPALPDPLEKQVESSYNLKLWK